MKSELSSDGSLTGSLKSRYNNHYAQKFRKEYKDLKVLVDIRDVYKELVDNIAEAEEIIADGSDTEMVEMAKMQLEEAKEE